MTPGWLDRLSFAFIALSILSALSIAADLWRRPQPMWIMALVWPLTALYAGPFGLWAYGTIGRAPARDERSAAGDPGRHHRRADKPFWQAVLTGSTHCGAGCAVGDFIAEWLVFAVGLTIFGSTLGASYVMSFVLAYLFGIFFQYFSVAPMRGLGFAAGLWAAIKIDTLSLIAYEVGMFAWMAIVHKLLFPGIEPTTWLFWFMMQVAMMLGLGTTFPVNWWLIRRGIKEVM